MSLPVSGVDLVGHGIGDRQDLPIPFAFAVCGAATALVVSFIVLALAWRDDRYGGRCPGRRGTFAGAT